MVDGLVAVARPHLVTPDVGQGVTSWTGQIRELQPGPWSAIRSEWNATRGFARRWRYRSGRSTSPGMRSAGSAYLRRWRRTLPVGGARGRRADRRRRDRLRRSTTTRDRQGNTLSPLVGSHLDTARESSGLPQSCQVHVPRGRAPWIVPVLAPLSKRGRDRQLGEQPWGGKRSGRQVHRGISPTAAAAGRRTALLRGSGSSGRSNR